MVHESTLDNGLTVLVQEVHTAPLASVWCWYKVGSRDEGPGVTGVSHWVEHMNFKGTQNIPRDQVKGIIEQFGGSWNGYTWIDQTTYLETATADALDRMLFIEAERMASCLYDPADCESERTVIISELQGGDNDPEQRLDTELTATAFKAHPYRHPTIGWIHDLQTMTRDDLYGHYRRYYVPNNATLVVVGDVDTADVLRARRGGLRRHRRRARRRGARTTEEPPQEGERRVHLRKPGTTAYWRAVFHAPRFADPDFFPLLALDAVLTGASGLNIWSGGNGADAAAQRAAVSRAREHRPGLVGRRLLAPTAEPFLYSRQRHGRPRPDAGGGGGGGARRVRSPRRATASPPPSWPRCCAQLRARFVFDGDSVTDLAHQLGYFATIGRWQDWHEVNARLAAVTLDARQRGGAQATSRPTTAPSASSSPPAAPTARPR